MVNEEEEIGVASGAASCPFCDEDDIRVVQSRRATWCVCQECSAEGPAAPTATKAVAAWNTRPAKVGP